MGSFYLLLPLGTLREVLREDRTSYDGEDHEAAVQARLAAWFR